MTAVSRVRGVAQSLDARLRRQRAHMPRRERPKPRLDNRPDPFQRKAVFAPAEQTGMFHRCGNGWRR